VIPSNTKKRVISFGLTGENGEPVFFGSVAVGKGASVTGIAGGGFDKYK
jgi:hypothetical protein